MKFQKKKKKDMKNKKDYIFIFFRNKKTIYIYI